MRPTESFDRKNVTEMGLELPERGQIPFDPDRDISSTDWQRFLAGIEQTRQEKGIFNVVEDLALVSMIDPTKATMTAEEKEQLRERLNTELTQSDPWNLRFLASGVAVIDKTLLTLTPEDLKRMHNQVNGFQLGELRVGGLAHLSLLDHDNVHLIDADRTMIADEFRKTRAAQNGEQLAKLAVAVARIDRSLVHLTPEDWDMMNHQFTSYRQNWIQAKVGLFLRHTANLSFLSRMFRTGSGPAPEIPPIPETKTFSR